MWTYSRDALVGSAYCSMVGRMGDWSSQTSGSPRAGKSLIPWPTSRTLVVRISMEKPGASDAQPGQLEDHILMRTLLIRAVEVRLWECGAEEEGF